MAITGYIADTEVMDRKILSKTIAVMNELNCEVIYSESTSVSNERPKLKYILGMVSDGDTIVFHKFSNAFANTLELTNLCRLCMSDNVRVVSVLDQIDSHGMFYKTSHKELFRLLSTFCQESYTKHKMKKLVDIPDTVKKIMKQRLQYEKEVQVVDMYQSDYSYQEIKEALHIKSNRTISAILSKHNIKPSRKKYKKAE